MFASPALPTTNNDCAFVATSLQLLGFPNAIPSAMGACCAWNSQYVMCGVEGFVTGLVFSGVENLASNQLTQHIPSTLSGLMNLQLLDLSDNQLSGGIPDMFAGMVQLGSVFLNGNALSGGIPASLAGLPQLIDM
ncbi:hypothetical protein HDU98_006218 [Podochytrium sp. JEL0797]|nr:hypothetical protein HDU98_006218 [Podochytrium sp. JEL0797]